MLDPIDGVGPAAKSFGPKGPVSSGAAVSVEIAEPSGQLIAIEQKPARMGGE
jgi:hypothetical protein